MAHEQYIKDCCRCLLHQLDHCPAGKITPNGGVLMPIAEVDNGFRKPNSKPPVAVYGMIDGQRWRLARGPSKRWQKA